MAVFVDIIIVVYYTLNRTSRHNLQRDLERKSTPKQKSIVFPQQVRHIESAPVSMRHCLGLQFLPAMDSLLQQL